MKKEKVLGDYLDLNGDSNEELFGELRSIFESFW
jgi:hypothetical protein